MKDPLRNIVPGEEADAIGWRDAEIERLLGLLGTAHALICQAVASRNNGGMTTTLTHDEMRAWLLAYADRATNSADAAPQFDPDALRTPDDPLSPNYDPEYSADEVQK